jgi:hypothetical protein
MAAGDGVGGRAGVISEAVARPDIIPPDEYVLAVRDQVLAQLLARASREVKHPLSATLMLWRDRKPVREFGERVSHRHRASRERRSGRGEGSRAVHHIAAQPALPQWRPMGGVLRTTYSSAVGRTAA